MKRQKEACKYYNQNVQRSVVCAGEPYWRKLELNNQVSCFRSMESAKERLHSFSTPSVKMQRAARTLRCNFEAVLMQGCHSLFHVVSS
jgi:hypothetical protein